MKENEITQHSGGELNLIRQMKHQLDATLCRFYFCRVTLHVSVQVPIIRSI